MKDYHFYMGDVDKAFIGYSSNPVYREDAASGGVVSSILIYLLNEKKIDGAIVSRQIMNNGLIQAEAFIATTKEEILSARTSIYTSFNYEKIFRKIKDFSGSLAAVLLPCNLANLNRYEKSHPEISGKIKYKFALFCGGVAKDELMYRILKKNKIEQNSIKRIYSRKGHWRGKMVLEMNNGETRLLSYNYNWSNYKNSFFYSEKKCFSCKDHFGNGSDFSFGDIWLSEMKKENIKHTAILAKNDVASDIIQLMAKDRLLEVKEVSPEYILKGNKRSVIYKFHTAEARSKLGRIFNYSYFGECPTQSRWNHYIGAFFILLNMKCSSSKFFQNIIFFLPRKLIYIYMVFTRIWISR